MLLTEKSISLETAVETDELHNKENAMRPWTVMLRSEGTLESKPIRLRQNATSRTPVALSVRNPLTICSDKPHVKISLSSFLKRLATMAVSWYQYPSGLVLGG